MFTYFHCYMPKTWQAQVNCGLIDENAGVRFLQSSINPDNEKFNVVAAKETPFAKMMEEQRLPMYIDRLQGGIYYENYNYDEELVKYYRDLLGDKFFGFQIHEWMSNLSNDIKRIRECLEGGEWTEKSITDAVFKKFPFPQLFIEAQSPKEHEITGNPKNVGEFFEIARSLFKRRMLKCSDQLIPCDSFGLAYKLEIDAGVKHFMPEIGAQTPDTRMQIAYARGMARTCKIDFGVYYEPWGGDPFSACCYNRDGDNEWGIGKKSDWPFETSGENGGSSRSLQKRAHLYGYFAGADYISEEWGMCNTFYDWRDFELTPYGKIKYDFLQLIKKYPKSEIGTPYTPVAIVLPKDYTVVSELGDIDGNDLWGYELTGELAKTAKMVKKGLKALVSNPSDMVGCETHAIINSDIPDAIDIIHEDRTKYSDYEYFVNLTGNDEFEKTHRCCSVEDVPGVLKKLLPCEIEGGVHWFVNRVKNGWLLVVFNNSGIHRSVAKGEYAMPEGDCKIRVRIKNGSNLIPLEGCADIKKQDEIYNMTIKSGEWFLAKFN